MSTYVRELNVFKLPIAIVISIILSLLCGCGGNSSDISSTVINYLTTTEESKLLTYLDNPSIQKINNLKKSYRSAYPFVWVHHHEDSKWRVIKIEKQNAKAYVTVMCVSHPKQNAFGMVITYQLVNEDGIWKIHIE